MDKQNINELTDEDGAQCDRLEEALSETLSSFSDKIVYFNTVAEKVNYIKNNLTTLETVLLNDDALTTMLIDMINKNKYGKTYPNANQIAIPRPYK
tara:strand:+ start:5549 stop:5836 length:288 start_codon:yes stop_codon:yes gene_type:complete